MLCLRCGSLFIQYRFPLSFNACLVSAESAGHGRVRYISSHPCTRAAGATACKRCAGGRFSSIAGLRALLSLSYPQQPALLSSHTGFDCLSSPGPTTAGASVCLTCSAGAFCPPGRPHSVQQHIDSEQCPSLLGSCSANSSITC